MSDEILKEILGSLNDLKSEQQLTNKRLDQLDAGQQTLFTGQKSLESGQISLVAGQKELQKDIKEIKTELRYVWDDIKRIDEKLTVHSEELQTLKRIK